MAGAREVRPRYVGVEGARLYWARKQANLSMRAVRSLGGPTISFQSEVENVRKWEVTTPTLAAWVRVLGVTVEFARGHTPKYTENPASCYGLARQVTELLKEAHSDTVWQGMTAATRIRELLQLTASKTEGFTLAVLAWVLGLDVEVLHKMIAGRQPVTEYVICALSDITTLPVAFIKNGTMVTAQEAEMYQPALYLALRKGMTPDQLYELVNRWEPPAAGGAADDSPGPNLL